MINMAYERLARATLSRDGMARLSGEVGYADTSAGELADELGELCGRFRRLPDPTAPAYGTGLMWHIQIAGMSCGREWRDKPVAAGAGATPYEAARGCVDDLRARARALLAQADRIEAMLS